MPFNVLPNFAHWSITGGGTVSSAGGVSSISVTGFSQQSGNINFSGLGGLVVSTGIGNFIYFSGGAGGASTINNYAVNSGSGIYIYRSGIQSGVTSQFIAFPASLDTRPLVLTTIHNDAFTPIMFCQVSGATTSGFWALLSSITDTTGYYLDILASNSSQTGMATNVIVNNNSYTSNSDGINLSGNLQTTGQNLYSDIIGLSGLLSGNLGSTGSVLYNDIIGLSGVHNSTPKVTGISVTGFSAQTGSINFSGLGGLVVSTGVGNFIYFSGGASNTSNSDGINLSGNLYSTGSNLYNDIVGLSGTYNSTPKVSGISVTGSFGLTGNINFSGLGSVTVSTGAGNFIYFSGSTVVGSATDMGAYNLVYLTGNQTITGIKTVTGIVITSGINNKLGTIIDTQAKLLISLNYGFPTYDWNNNIMSGQSLFLTPFKSADFTNLALYNFAGISVDWINLVLSGDWRATTFGIGGSGGYSPVVAYNNLTGLGNITISSGVNGSTRFVYISGDSNSSITISGNLGSTGSVLYNYIVGLSGSDNATPKVSGISVTGFSAQTGIINFSGLGGLTVSTGINNFIYFSGNNGDGINLSGNLASTGQQSWNAANNNSINISGNLQTTGSNLYKYLIGLSGILNTGVAAISVTGNQMSGIIKMSGVGNIVVGTGSGNLIYVSGLYSDGINLSGNLASTGSNLYGYTSSLSGVHNSTPKVSGISVTGSFGLTGNINFSGLGGLVVSTGAGNFIYFSGASSSSSTDMGAYNIVYQTGDQMINGNKTFSNALGIFISALTTNSGGSDIVINPSLYTLYDSTPSPSVNWNTYQLTSTNYGLAIDWGLGILTGTKWTAYDLYIGGSGGKYPIINYGDLSGVGNITIFSGNRGLYRTVFISGSSNDGINLSGNLGSTGANLYNWITVISGNSNTVSTNLGSTGSTLYGYIGSLSGVHNSTPKVSGITVTGSFGLTGNINFSGLGGLIVSTGAGNFIYFSGGAGTTSNSDGINLSGNLGTTGSVLYNDILGLSGIVNTNSGVQNQISITGKLMSGIPIWSGGGNIVVYTGSGNNIYVSGLYSDATNLSGNLQTTGQNLYSYISSLSGVHNTTPKVSGITVTGASLGLTGNINFSGIGTITVSTGTIGTWIYFSGGNNDAINISGNLVSTGSVLYNDIIGLSGIVNTNSGVQNQISVTGKLMSGIPIWSGGGNIVVYTGSGNNIYISGLYADGVNLSGNLGSTGSTLFGYIGSLSGVHNKTPKVSGISVTGSFGLTGNIGISGVGGITVLTGSLGNNVIYISGNNLALSGDLTTTGQQLVTTGFYFSPTKFISGLATGASPVGFVGSFTFDWSSGSMFNYTLSGNTIFAFTGDRDGQSISIAVRNTGSSGFSGVWPANVRWPYNGGIVAPQQTSGNFTDIYTFMKMGTGIFANTVQQFVNFL
jgi:hypothetical protein